MESIRILPTDKKSSGTTKKIESIFRVDFRELAIGKFRRILMVRARSLGKHQKRYFYLWPNQPVHIYFL